MKKIKFSTPYGVAQYPHISSPDTKGKYADNKFKTKLVFKIDDPKALAAVEKIKEAAVEIHGTKGLKLHMPFAIDEDDGTITFTAKSAYAPSISDSKGNKVPKNLPIRSGAQIALGGLLIEYDKGISFQLHAVRVKELTSDSFEFEEVEDGFVYDGEDYTPEAGGTDSDEDEGTPSNGSALDI